MLSKIVSGCLFLSTIAYGQDFQEDQTALDVGIGVFRSADKGLSETKMLSIGKQETLLGPLKSRYSAGFWLDNTRDGRKSSGFVGAQLGFEVANNGWVGGIFSGPTVISTPDVLLGGRFQFMDTINYGLQDKSGNYIGLFYRHFSSAGLEMPNTGRDILGIEIRF